MSLRSRCILFSISVLLTLTISNASDDDLTFPPDFILGTATAAFQIEGAWNISDKGESNWDHYVHYHPEKIDNGDTGDIACDSYHKYKEDVQLIKELGLDHYRFSVSWSRILPTGYANVISKDGIRYYHNLLDELEKNNIEPSVTLHHYDHPQIFQEIGGFTNEAIVDLFGEYARVVFREFGHRVKLFYTINEPAAVCEGAYYRGNLAPGLKAGKHIEYLCAHNMLKSHARAYHIYNDEFRAQQKGKIGIVLDCNHFFAKNENDNQSEEVAFQYLCGRYAHPIFSKNGDYPEIFKERIAENSKYEGLRQSRLPTFSKYWIDYIKGSSDFFGLNHYTSWLVEPAPKSKETVYVEDHGILKSDDPKWPKTTIPNNKIVPEGFGALLRKIKEEYDNPPLIVTENGIADEDTYEDNDRQKYLYLYMKVMLNAIKRDGCNVKGYFIWSFLDNFEWSFGYGKKFGIFRVDFNHPNRTRTPRKSVSWLKDVIRSRKLQVIE